MKIKQVFIITLALIVLTNSCSSSSKAKIYGGATGSILGGFLGHSIAKSTSPNKESLPINQKIGLATGAVIGALTGALIANYFYLDDPENREGPPLFQNENKNLSPQVHPQIPENNLSFKSLGIPQTNIYQIPTSTDLPDHIKNLIQKQILIEHQIPTQLIQQPDGSTLIINGTTATEHRYISQ